MPAQPTENIDEEYFKVWNFTNYREALDGKHVKTKCPSHSGSMYYNYKQYFSIVLQGVCDANYRFSVIRRWGLWLTKRRRDIPKFKYVQATN